MADRDPSALRASVPFQPDMSQLDRMPLFKANLVPRYLFRLYSPKTVGTTSTSHVIPSSVCSTDPNDSRDIFSLSKYEAARRLNHHLRWWPSHEKTCNLMSWSTSLLFELQYGLYKHRSLQDGSELSDINLMILDTHDLPPGTFVKDLEIIDVFAPYSFGFKTSLDSFKGLRSRQAYYFGEYLSQGDLDLEGKCAQVSLQTLVDLGVFELIPDLANQANWTEWVNAVLKMRKPFEERTHLDTTHDEVHKAIDIAKAAFGEPWTIPVAAMLLSLKPRMTRDNIITDVFKSKFSPDELKRAALRDICIDADRLPEVEEFRRLIRDIDDLLSTNDQLDIDDHLNTVSYPSLEDFEDPLVGAFEALNITKVKT